MIKKQFKIQNKKLMFLIIKRINTSNKCLNRKLKSNNWKKESKKIFFQMIIKNKWNLICQTNCKVKKNLIM